MSKVKKINSKWIRHQCQSLFLEIIIAQSVISSCTLKRKPMWTRFSLLKPVFLYSVFLKFSKITLVSTLLSSLLCFTEATSLFPKINSLQICPSPLHFVPELHSQNQIIFEKFNVPTREVKLLGTFKFFHFLILTLINQSLQIFFL